MRRQVIPFFTDNNAPDSVGDALVAHGHTVTRLRDCMARDSKDPVIAVACIQNGQVLVSWDNDFRGIADRLRARTPGQAKRFHRVAMQCNAARAATRIGDAMSLIEHEWMVAQHRGEAMVIEIRDNYLRVQR